MTDEEYTRYDLFDPFDGSEIRCREARVFTVRQERACHLSLQPGLTPHTIKPGERARYDHALVDGKWCSCHVCIPCLDGLSKFLR